MKYDVIVVGSGSAGSVVATRLSEDPQLSVLLIEAGPDYPKFEHLPDEIKFGYSSGVDLVTTHHNWEFQARGTDTSGAIDIPRGKVTGGTSAINGQVFLRGDPEDFDAWAAKGNEEWNFQKVLNYYRKVETDSDYGGSDFHNTDGPIICHRFPKSEWLPPQQAFYTAARTAGFADCPDFNHPEGHGVGAVPLNNPNGIRLSTALGYLNVARHRINLTIKPDCTVHKVVIKNGRVTGVEVKSGGERFTVESDQVVLSAGSIGSPHILMLSGIGPAEQLNAVNIPTALELPGVGQNLRDHPIVIVSFQPHAEHVLETSKPRIQVGMRWTAQDSSFRNDVQVLMCSVMMTDPFAADTARITAGLRIGMYTFVNLAKSSGELRIASADPNDTPLLDLRYFEDGFDLKRMREIIRTCVAIGEHESFNQIIESRIAPTDEELESDDSLDEFIRRTVVSAQHLSGTCKMGPSSDSMAVVDQYGSVHGIGGLRVADASIMPDCIRANTNLTTMMIGERIADFMRQV